VALSAVWKGLPIVNANHLQYISKRVCKETGTGAQAGRCLDPGGRIPHVCAAQTADGDRFIPPFSGVSGVHGID